MSTSLATEAPEARGEARAAALLMDPRAPSTASAGGAASPLNPAAAFDRLGSSTGPLAGDLAPQGSAALEPGLNPGALGGLERRAWGVVDDGAAGAAVLATAGADGNASGAEATSPATSAGGGPVPPAQSRSDGGGGSPTTPPAPASAVHVAAGPTTFGGRPPAGGSGSPRGLAAVAAAATAAAGSPRTDTKNAPVFVQTSALTPNQCGFCSTRSTSGCWRRGWALDGGVFINLCNRCGLRHKAGKLEGVPPPPPASTARSASGASRSGRHSGSTEDSANGGAAASGASGGALQAAANGSGGSPRGIATAAAAVQGGVSGAQQLLLSAALSEVLGAAEPPAAAAMRRAADGRGLKRAASGDLPLGGSAAAAGDAAGKPRRRASGKRRPMAVIGEGPGGDEVEAMAMAALLELNGGPLTPSPPGGMRRSGSRSGARSKPVSRAGTPAGLAASPGAAPGGPTAGGGGRSFIFKDLQEEFGAVVEASRMDWAAAGSSDAFERLSAPDASAGGGGQQGGGAAGLVPGSYAALAATAGISGNEHEKLRLIAALIGRADGVAGASGAARKGGGESCFGRPGSAASGFKEPHDSVAGGRVLLPPAPPLIPGVPCMHRPAADAKAAGASHAPGMHVHAAAAAAHAEGTAGHGVAAPLWVTAERGESGTLDESGGAAGDAGSGGSTHMHLAPPAPPTTAPGMPHGATEGPLGLWQRPAAPPGAQRAWEQQQGAARGPAPHSAPLPGRYPPGSLDASAPLGAATAAPAVAAPPAVAAAAAAAAAPRQRLGLPDPSWGPARVAAWLAAAGAPDAARALLPRGADGVFLSGLLRIAADRGGAAKTYDVFGDVGVTDAVVRVRCVEQICSLALNIAAAAAAAAARPPAAR